MTIQFKDFINEATKYQEIMGLEGSHAHKLLMINHIKQMKIYQRKYGGILVVFSPPRGIAVRGLLSTSAATSYDFDYALSKKDHFMFTSAIKSTHFKFGIQDTYLVLISSHFIIWPESHKANVSYLLADPDVSSDYSKLRKEMQRETDPLFEEVADDDVVGMIQEVLSATQRMAKKRSLRKNKAKIKRGRRRSDRKTASKNTINKRANRRARSAEKKKVSKGKSSSDMSYSQRASVERRLKSRSGIIARKGKRLRIKTRKDDRK